VSVCCVWCLGGWLGDIKPPSRHHPANSKVLSVRSEGQYQYRYTHQTIPPPLKELSTTTYCTARTNITVRPDRRYHYSITATAQGFPAPCPSDSIVSASVGRAGPFGPFPPSILPSIFSFLLLYFASSLHRPGQSRSIAPVNASWAEAGASREA
jgi:hypothetical protein